MADLALALGQPQLAVQMGRELETQLRGSRHLRSLAIARANLVTALLACDDLRGARAMAELAWPMAAAWKLQPSPANVMNCVTKRPLPHSASAKMPSLD